MAKDDKKPVKQTKTSAATNKTPIKKPAVSKKAAPKAKAVKIEKPVKEKTVDNKPNKRTEEPKMETNSESQAKLEDRGNFTDKVWRLIAMIAFAFIGYFALFAIIILSAMQFIVVLLESKPNTEVQSLVDKLASFMREIFNFMAYKTDVMPFPFSKFPK